MARVRIGSMPGNLVSSSSVAMLRMTRPSTVTPGLDSASASASDDVPCTSRTEACGPRGASGGDGAAGCGGGTEGHGADWDTLGSTLIASIVAGGRAPAV